ncbi:DUF423 domain-containing protein [Chitinasiproducens palmae]|uniref:Uncharacterized membrane protein YgdD, TMEM256/DUF423 family n=1 Tax=Chitinasiproducens palmae TaxID=1770053 RepID=A0A1H2PR35_9BURK|nr:DUF423 domain-containing protein [Chitinasiproducens palmae]SDV49351.1 Uncharacterized membrane protein YgdD, TMEM256/DUF423 family [Chitinasiproducens palmae]
MNDRILTCLGALNMFIAVGAGAFGAHGLKQRLSADMLAVWQTGVTYHLIHGLGLLLIASLAPRLAAARVAWSGSLMQAGIVLFSGSLYLLALLGARPLGIVTPIGGVLLLASWAVLAWSALR